MATSRSFRAEAKPEEDTMGGLMKLVNKVVDALARRKVRRDEQPPGPR